MEVVIAHPNGWGIREQTFLRGAAVEAGFAGTNNARTNIRFVTEAEASVHFCVYHTNLGERLKVLQGVLVRLTPGTETLTLPVGRDELCRMRCGRIYCGHDGLFCNQCSARTQARRKACFSL